MASDREEVIDVRKSKRKVPKDPKEPKKNQKEHEEIKERKNPIRQRNQASKK